VTTGRRSDSDHCCNGCKTHLHTQSAHGATVIEFDCEKPGSPKLKSSIYAIARQQCQSIADGFYEKLIGSTLLSDMSALGQ
jgi:hypothetical protein